MSSSRITIIVRDSAQAERDWRSAGKQARIFAESVDLVGVILAGGPEAVDVERVVIDRAATDLEFLALLAFLPDTYCGDVLYVRSDGTGFLSAAGRGSGRVLYALRNTDVRFYLETHEMVTSRAVTELKLAG